MLWGIDYGARFSGNTAIAELKDKFISIYRVEKGVDADAFILNQLEETGKPELLFLDAPLSLPKVYRKKKFKSEDDFFYRRSDRELGAMSPLFLGALSARAIKLNSELQEQSLQVFETWPSALKRTLSPDADRNKKVLQEAFEKFVPDFLWEKQIQLHMQPADIHEWDALAALISAIRYKEGKATSYGEEKEGLIWI
jgi:predicted nuclease with RNAse H fold